jgi:predicted transcriptional regulator
MSEAVKNAAKPAPAHADLERIVSLLKSKGEQLDADIATALRLPLASVKRNIAQLSASGDIMTCQVIRYRGEQKVEGLSCRVAGFIPPRTAGRKPGAPPAAK